TYGGDGKSNFALPNLQGSTPMQQGQGPGLSLRDLGETGGEQNVTLLETEIPAHNHTVVGSSGSAGQSSPAGNAWASAPFGRPSIYAASGANVQMNPSAASLTGGNLPHNNMMPYLGLNFIIALQGVFPPRS
ncbi:MAG: phage tail protein, partial [Terriglobales bacterium]